MGTLNSKTHTLPQMWQRINESHLRHRTTLEIIEEHTLCLRDQEEQMAVLLELQKRISFYHPGIPRVIYFRQSQKDGACSVFGGEYRIMMYTQYRGDCLQKVAEEMGERFYHSPCQCVLIFNAISYLYDRYGSFAVTPKMIFLGNRRQRMSKVWIHQKIESSIPQFSINEVEMCDSVCKLMQFMKNKRMCVSVDQEQLQIAASLKQFKELQTFIVVAHKHRNNSTDMNVPRKKACSELAHQKKPQQIKNYNTTQRIDKSYNNHNNALLINNYPVNPKKIKFSYKTNNLISTQQSLPYIEDKQSLVKVQMTHPVQINLGKPNYSKQIIQAQKDHFFSAIKGTNESSKPLVIHFNSPKSSPQSIQRQVNITVRQIELPLKEQEDKGTFSRLPTTSRSPKIVKQHNFHPIQQIPETNEHISTNQQRLQGWKQKTVSLHSSANKFQKYRDAIKNYQNKLRKKFANSTGSNPLTAQRKKDLVMLHPAATPTKGEYKETESVYNNSEDEEPERKISIPFEKDLFDENKALIPVRVEERKDLEQTNEYSNEQQLQSKRFREQLQKIELERDLQRQKAMIDNQMQDLLRSNGKDEYRSIRDKIKQKKETFAQLKAEAAKILQDLDY